MTAKPPRRRSRMIGRVPELTRLTAELTRRRVVTVVGPGGIGKSRLALEAAWSVEDQFPGGCIWIDLAELEQTAVLPDVIASALGCSHGDASRTDGLAAGIVEEDALLILDCCDFGSGAVAVFVDRMASTRSRLTVLATSRQPLGVPGETIFRLGPLDRTASVELFYDRALDDDAMFRFDEASHAAAAALVCEMSGGLPLTIEMTASHIHSMTLTEIAEQPPQGFPSRLIEQLPARHLRQSANVEWSLRLLTGAEQTLLSQLSVLPSEWTAVEAQVMFSTAKRSELDSWLSTLVDKSVLVADRTGRQTLYRIPRHIRDHLCQEPDDGLRLVVIPRT